MKFRPEACDSSYCHSLLYQRQQIARLQKEKARLEQELAKARFVVDVQSKLQALLA